MFVRFRQTKHRLQVSLVETRRIDGHVRQGHVASLGSVPLPPSLQDRLTFCSACMNDLADSQTVSRRDCGKGLGRYPRAHAHGDSR